jgi:hypothetical protein
VDWEKERAEFLGKPGDREKQRAENERQEKLDEQKAEDIFEKGPDYWPEETRRGAYWIRLLLSKRWQIVSTKPLDTKTDIASIRKAVRRDMKIPPAKVDEIGWLSSSVVMVSSRWYQGPLGAGGFIYVLQKGKDGWVILRRYLMWVA